MNAKKCDRCGEFYAQYRGKLYNDYEVNAMNLANDRASFIEIVDLCPACMDKQIRFLSGTELTGGEKNEQNYCD